jgi:D-inositol-3-phosphate glycosyltransferase
MIIGATQQRQKSDGGPIGSTGSSEVTYGSASTPAHREIGVALLTGGGDKHYVLGLASALGAQGIQVDCIGSDELDVPELRRVSSLTFFNLRRDQRTGVSLLNKGLRVLAYYMRLAHYSAIAQPKIFHILWNNKFEFFDRTLLMAYYRLLGKWIIFTAHNVNAGKRDGKDTYLNRLSLRIQYQLANHIFVHTTKMGEELRADFCVPPTKITVIPYGINNAVPNTGLTAPDAKRKLGLDSREKTLLFFGHIAPYKGLEYLLTAFTELAKKDSTYRLIVAGRVKGCEDYWAKLQQRIASNQLDGQIICRIDFVPDEEVEDYFKAADVLVLPYTHIFQSGVLFLAYSFGLPVIASDAGSLRESIVEGRSGYICTARDPADLAKAIKTYFASELYVRLEERRPHIRRIANERHSWDKVGEITRSVYDNLIDQR